MMSRFAVKTLGALTCAPSLLPEEDLSVPCLKIPASERSFEKLLLAILIFRRGVASSGASVGGAPGLIDFLGGRLTAAPATGAGKWLCRRALGAKGTLGGPMISIFAVAGTSRCELLLCRCKSDPLRAIFDGLLVGPIPFKPGFSPVPLLMIRLPLVPRSSRLPPPPGAGNSLRLGPPGVRLV